MNDLPSSKESEMMVLGCMLQNINHVNESRDLLLEADFFYSEHRLVFQAMVSLAKKDNAVEVHTVAEELKRKDQLKSVGGTGYLMALCQYAGLSASIEDYIALVKNKSMLRQMVIAAEKIKAEALSQPDDVAFSLDNAQKEFFRIGQGINTGDFSYVREIWDGSKSETGKSFIQEIQEEQERFLKKELGEPVEEREVMTGFYDLDDLMGGMGNSNLIILAARTNMGKTALAVQIAQNVAERYRKPTAFFSLEMSSGQLVSRIAFSTAEVSTKEVKERGMTPLEFQRLVEVTATMQSPLIIDDQVGITINQIRQRARRMKEAHGIKFIVIDYLQLVGSPKSFKAENRQVEVAELSRTLKIIARELNVPVLCLAQLNREVEKRDGNRPKMSDLRESGAIEQDADQIIVVHRPEYFNPNDSPGKAEILLLKNRHGPTGKTELQFDKRYGKFNNLVRDQQIKGNHYE